MSRKNVKLTRTWSRWPKTNRTPCSKSCKICWRGWRTSEGVRSSFPSYLFFHNKCHHGHVRWTLGWFNFLDDIHVLINEAKEGAADVNATADDAKTRMQNISEELNKIKISSLDSNLTNLLDGVNKTCQSPQFFFPKNLDIMHIIQSSKMSVKPSMSI